MRRKKIAAVCVCVASCLIAGAIIYSDHSEQDDLLQLHPFAVSDTTEYVDSASVPTLTGEGAAGSTLTRARILRLRGISIVDLLKILNRVASPSTGWRVSLSEVSGFAGNVPFPCFEATYLETGAKTRQRKTIFAEDDPELSSGLIVIETRPLSQPEKISVLVRQRCGLLKVDNLP